MCDGQGKSGGISEGLKCLPLFFFVFFYLRFTVLKAMSCDTAKVLIGWGELNFLFGPSFIMRI